jgi:thymidylate kinase
MKLRILTFSGVDGAGKTTILNEIRSVLEGDYGLTVVELRQRPSILPILSSLRYGKKRAEQRTLEVLPRSGSNTSRVSSYLRFFYYLSDYIFGQWIVYFRHTLKGHVLLYDRYYFDYIADPRRANILVNKQFATFFYKLIIKPDVNIFLYASPEVILQRKQELDSTAIRQLTENYQEIFCEMDRCEKGRYICINNVNKLATLKQILETVRQGLE